MITAAEAHWQYGISGALQFDETEGGLVRGVITTRSADAEIYLQGAHVARWTPAGQKPVLFMSSQSLFAPGKAIRGGVPVIFPWFGGRSDGQPGPAHGFARSLPWALEKTRVMDSGSVEIALLLAPTDETRSLGFDSFEVRFRVSFGSALRMELEVRNTAEAPLRYEEALHSYFAVSNIQNVTVSGLERTTYIDKTDGLTRKIQPATPVRCAKETDQVHVKTSATSIIHDAEWNRRIMVEKRGSNSTIVWNPWSEKAAGMADMGPGEWERMICVESGNAADDAITLAPGEVHKLSTVIRVS